jgi:hypothetical protein
MGLITLRTFLSVVNDNNDRAGVPHSGLGRGMRRAMRLMF